MGHTSIPNVTSSGAIIGSVVPHAGPTAPVGYLLCYGQTLDAVANPQYLALFNIIGNTYGGTDSSNFVLPDLRGRTLAGKDDMGGSAAARLTSDGSGITGTALGAAGGDEIVTLGATQIPGHTHNFAAWSGGQNANHTHYDSGHGHSWNPVAPLGDTYGYYGAWYTLASGGNHPVLQTGINNASANLGGVSSDHAHYTSGTTDTGGVGTGAHSSTQPTIILNYIIAYK